jgi:hypothetical protein
MSGAPVRTGNTAATAASRHHNAGSITTSQLLLQQSEKKDGRHFCLYNLPSNMFLKTCQRRGQNTESSGDEAENARIFQVDAGPQIVGRDGGQDDANSNNTLARTLTLVP